MLERHVPTHTPCGIRECCCFQWPPCCITELAFCCMSLSLPGSLFFSLLYVIFDSIFSNGTAQNGQPLLSGSKRDRGRLRQLYWWIDRAGWLSSCRTSHQIVSLNRPAPRERPILKPRVLKWSWQNRCGAKLSPAKPTSLRGIILIQYCASGKAVLPCFINSVGKLAINCFSSACVLF